MKLFYVTLALFSVQFIFGQLSEERMSKLLNSGSQKELIEANTDLMIQGMHYQAMLLINKLLESDADNANYNYRKGRSMMALGYDPATVVPFLLKGSAQTNRMYNSASATEKNAPNDTYFWLAKCYHQMSDLDNAEANYQKYLDVEVYKQVEMRKFAQNGLQQVANARREIAAPRNFVVKNAGNAINTKNPDYASFVNLDGTALYFTSRRVWENQANMDIVDPAMNLPWEAIFVSYKNGSNWTAPKLLDFCSPENNYASVSVSKDERVIYTYNDKSANGDIYLSNLVDGEFKTYEKVEIPRINTKYWEPHFVISPDGNALFFVSDRPGGFGGRDIWKLEKLSNGEWSRDPINLGAEINSPFDEDSPFIALDGKTLFYATNGPKSIGGFDIMKVVMNADGSFGSPENMGYPVNSTHDDIYFSSIGSGEIAYFTSSRKGGQGEKDIYEVSLNNQKVEQVALLRALVKTKDGSPIPSDVSAMLICSNCSERGEVETLPRLRDGVILTPLEKCKNYELVYMQRGTELHREKFSTTCDEKFQQIDKQYTIGVGPSKDYYLDASVKDTKTGNPVSGVTVEIVSISGAPTKHTFNTDENGKFKAEIFKGYAYGTSVPVNVILKKDGYLVMNLNETIKLDEKEGVILNLNIDPKMADPIFKMAMIYYDFDKSDIRDDAEVELNKLIQYMNDNPDVVVELTSHTDCRGSDAYNMALSQRRAASAVAYVKKGLKSNPKRITGKGMGESKMIGNCTDANCEACSEEQHQANRRTEFVIRNVEKPSTVMPNNPAPKK